MQVTVSWPACIVLLGSLILLGVMVKLNVPGAGIAALSVVSSLSLFFTSKGISKTIPPPPMPYAPEDTPTRPELLLHIKKPSTPDPVITITNGDDDDFKHSR